MRPTATALLSASVLLASSASPQPAGGHAAKRLDGKLAQFVFVPAVLNCITAE